MYTWHIVSTYWIYFSIAVVITAAVDLAGQSETSPLSKAHMRMLAGQMWTSSSCLASHLSGVSISFLELKQTSTRLGV